MIRLYLFLGLAMIAGAQRQEAAFTLGGVASPARPPQSPGLGSGRAWQANYGYRLLERPRWALLGEVHLLASPLRRTVSRDPAATRDAASLYLTPGIRLKLFPRRRVNPYGTIGGGWALQEQSLLTIGGSPNPAPRLLHRGVWQFGGGIDIHLWRFLSLRGEVRDFFAGHPAFNLPVRGHNQNITVGGGIVLLFGDRRHGR